MNRFSSFIIAIKINNEFCRTITGIALSVLFCKTNKIIENKHFIWNPIVYPLIIKNKLVKISNHRILKMIEKIYKNYNLIFKGTTYSSKRSAITL